MSRQEPTKSGRDEFLLVMYGKMWDNINRHLTVVWESAAILAGAVAVFALTENGTLSVDIASTLLVIVSAWTVLHAYDANSWYNRNLAIIANIERLFLKPSDAKDVHSFFLKHRDCGLVEHLRIHAFLGMSFGVLTLLYHFSIRVWPGLGAPLAGLEPLRFLPYLAALAAAIAVGVLRRHYIEKHREFEANSPGVAAPTK